MADHSDATTLFRPTRRALLQAGAVAAATTAVAAVTSPTARAASDPYLVGAGKADVTGAIAGQGMMGYSDTAQVAEGLLSRTLARAFVIGVPGGARIVFVTVDIACIFESHRHGVLQALAAQFGDLYTDQNVNINATHNHNSCGGTAWDFAYSIAAFGFKKNSYEAEVAGIVEAIVAAHNSVAPGTIEVGRSELHNASANRSLVAFRRNPLSDRQHFPEHIDPAVTVLRLRQGDTVIGDVTWFATHGTSLTDANKLISVDNKGYAAMLAESAAPGIISAHAQSNSGDMTPNLWLRKLDAAGPTANHRTNCELIGHRQHDARTAAISAATTVTTQRIQSITRFVDMAALTVAAEWTPEQRVAHTTPAIMGAAAAATSTEDNTRSQLPFLFEGMTNPFLAAFGGSTPNIPQWARDWQAPKLGLIPLGYMPPQGWVGSILPLQLLRIGDLVLVAVPAECTIVAGLRIKRAVADALGVHLDDVLLQGYSNAYSQYVTTEEEYDSQQYEGGETIFGRYTCAAYQQEFYRLARDLRRGETSGGGPQPINKSGFQPDLVSPPPADLPVAGHRFGDVLEQPAATLRRIDTAHVRFVAAHPNARIRRGETYFVVQRRAATGWETVFTDTDWCTELHWSRYRGSGTASVVDIYFRPATAPLGTYRIRYTGDRKDSSGRTHPISGTSNAFEVTA